MNKKFVSNDMLSNSSIGAMVADSFLLPVIWSATYI